MGYAQTQSSPSVVAIVARIGLGKGIENFLLIFLGNSNACIENFQYKRFGIGWPSSFKIDSDPNGAKLRR